MASLQSQQHYKKINIKIGTVKIGTALLQFEAELDTDSTVAGAIWEALPIRAEVNRWGDEIYFDIGIDIEMKNPVEQVNIGDIAYWQPGKALCIFFGKTPISSSGDDIIRPASAVEVIGKFEPLKVVVDQLKKVSDGIPIVIERVSD